MKSAETPTAPDDAGLRDEPARHRVYMVFLGLVALATAPFPFVAAPPRLLAGYPLWLWWSAFFTLLLAVLTSWGLLRFWRDESDPNGPEAGPGADREPGEARPAAPNDAR